MNLASILINKILTDADSETWAALKKNYLPKEYHKLHDTIQKHIELYSSLPSFQDLKLSTRHSHLKEQVFSIEISEQVDIACNQLLEYLKNEYAQTEVLSLIEKFLDNSVATSTAEEIVDYIQDIVLQLEEKIDLQDPEEDVGKISLFEPDDVLERRITLGLNTDFDSMITYGPGEYVMFGGFRGSGKSILCANIAVNTYNKGDSSIYFTIEMSTRETLQRMCAIATGVASSAIQHRNLSINEWEKVAKWWAHRFENGEEEYYKYLKHRNFDNLHASLLKSPLRQPQLDIVYDPSLTLTKIQTELDKKVKILNPKVVIVDYINQVERGVSSYRKISQYDWTEQIQISKGLKKIAQKYGIVLVSPYQIDATGQARMAKGILDAPDVAFVIKKHDKKDGILELEGTKARNHDDEISFISSMNWASLKIGPENGYLPGDEEPTGEEAQEL